MGERSGAPRASALYQSSFSKPPVAVQLPQPDVSANRDAPNRKTGWQFVCVEEEWTRGYIQEIQDFMECVAFGRQPLAGLDLAYEAIRIHYAAYWAAEEGRRISL